MPTPVWWVFAPKNTVFDKTVFGCLVLAHFLQVRSDNYTSFHSFLRNDSCSTLIDGEVRTHSIAKDRYASSFDLAEFKSTSPFFPWIESGEKSSFISYSGKSEQRRFPSSISNSTSSTHIADKARVICLVNGVRLRKSQQVPRYIGAKVNNCDLKEAQTRHTIIVRLKLTPDTRSSVLLSVPNWLLWQLFSPCTSDLPIGHSINPLTWRRLEVNQSHFILITHLTRKTDFCILNRSFQ